MRVQSLGPEDPLEEGIATHSSILAWRILWTEEPGRLQSMGSQRVGHDLETKQQKKRIYLKSPFSVNLLLVWEVGLQIPVASTCTNSDLFLYLSPHFSETAMFSLQLLSLYYCPESLGNQRAHQICFIFLRNQSSECLLFNACGQLFYILCPVFQLFTAGRLTNTSYAIVTTAEVKQVLLK